MNKIFSLLLFLITAEKLMLTVEELEQYDGRNGKIYIACAGLIFDVTESQSYQAKGSYAIFAGKDVTVALAKYSFDKKWFNMRAEEAGLTEGQRKAVEGWRDFYTDKYPIVGELVYSKFREEI